MKTGLAECHAVPPHLGGTATLWLICQTAMQQGDMSANAASSNPDAPRAYRTFPSERESSKLCSHIWCFDVGGGPVMEQDSTLVKVVVRQLLVAKTENMLVTF